MQIRNHLSRLCLTSFSRPLQALSEVIDIKDSSFIDGGAASGSTAMEMLPFLGDEGHIYCFEPFPGNHRFFDSIHDNRIVLIKKAISDVSGHALFSVSSKVDEGAEGRWSGMTGYSSVGELVSKSTVLRRTLQFRKNKFLNKLRSISGDKKNSTEVQGYNPEYFRVETATVDHEVPDVTNISFVKLDLQGGELKALLGMKEVLKHCKMMWVEFTGLDATNILEIFARNNFIAYDSQYLFSDDSAPRPPSDMFAVTSEIRLSTGRAAYFARRMIDYNNFIDEFMYYSHNHGLIQTDLLLVKREINDIVINRVMT